MNAPVPTLDIWPEQVIRGHSIPDTVTPVATLWRKNGRACGRGFGYCWAGRRNFPEPGDWQMEPVGREEVLMVRQQDHSIKAFFNVRQHRGNPLVDKAKGSNPRRFVCRYHSWAFLPDGGLQFAPDKEDFPEGNPCGKLRLAELKCETFAGFIWVNMDPDCGPLRDYLTNLGRVAGQRGRYLAAHHG